MKKNAKKVKVMVACECSTCGQKSHAQAETIHFGCKGIKLAPGKRLPPNLSFPNRKGTWKVVA